MLCPRLFFAAKEITRQCSNSTFNFIYFALIQIFIALYIYETSYMLRVTVKRFENLSGEAPFLELLYGSCNSSPISPLEDANAFVLRASE